MDEQAVAPARDRRGQPQAAAPSERERRPHRPAAHAHPDLVGLYLPRVDVADHLIVPQGGVRPGLVQPDAHRALVQPEGGHAGRDRAAVEEQRARQRQRQRRLRVM